MSDVEILEEPDTDVIEACIESDPEQAQELMRKKLRCQAQRIERRFSPAQGTPAAVKKP